MAKKRPPLTKKRQEWAEQRGGHVFKGGLLHYPAAPADRYQKRLMVLVREMEKAYRREMEAIFKEYGPVTQDASLASQARIALSKLQARFAKLFNQKAKPIVEQIFGQVDKASATSLHESLKELSGGLSLKTKIMTPALSEAMTAAIAENVSLIKSIPQRYHLQIEGAVMRSMQPGGNGLQEVTEALSRYEGITRRRVDIIALDQVRKATTAFNTERAKAAGIRKFEWVHSAGSAEPRKKHVDADGKIYSFDDPPRIGDNGEPVLPGQAINCRCVARPIVDFGED